MTDREKLIELIKGAPGTEFRADRNLVQWGSFDPTAEQIADHLIANGVTVQRWVPVEAGELKNYIGVPVCIKRKTDGECWWAIIRGIKGDKVSTDYDGYFKLSEYGEIWMVKYLPLPQPPKEEKE